MTFARLTAVYGLQYTELRYKMPLASIETYLDRIPTVLAERKVMIASAAGYPHMEDPEDAMSSWLEEAYGNEFEKEAATPGMLKLIGIGVEHAGKS